MRDQCIFHYAWRTQLNYPTSKQSNYHLAINEWFLLCLCLAKIMRENYNTVVSWLIHTVNTKKESINCMS